MLFYFKIFLLWNLWLGDVADVLTPGQGPPKGLPLQLRCPCGHTVAQLSLRHSVYTGLFKSRHFKGSLYSCHAYLLGVHMRPLASAGGQKPAEALLTAAPVKRDR